MEEAPRQPADAGRQLAPDEVERLDAVGAFVDHGDAGIAHELLHAPFLDIAVAAVDLLRHGGALVAVVGHIGLDHRGQEGDEVVGLLAPLGIGMRSEEHTSELQSLMRISYAVFCLKTNTKTSRKK